MKAVRATPEITSFALPERLDSATAPAIERSVLDALRPGARVLIDGAGLTYMSAAGVRLLATVLHRAEERDARVVFCRFTGAAADCLQVSGFSQLLDIAPSLEEAAARLRTIHGNGGAGRLHAEHGTG